MKEYYQDSKDMMDDDENDETSSVTSFDSLSTTNDEPTPWDSNILEMHIVPNVHKFTLQIPKPTIRYLPSQKTHLTVLHKNKKQPPRLCKQQSNKQYTNWCDVVSHV